MEDGHSIDTPDTNWLTVNMSPDQWEEYMDDKNWSDDSRVIHRKIFTGIVAFDNDLLSPVTGILSTKSYNPRRTYRQKVEVFGVRYRRCAPENFKVGDSAAVIYVHHPDEGKIYRVTSIDGGALALTGTDGNNFRSTGDNIKANLSTPFPEADFSRINGTGMYIRNKDSVKWDSLHAVGCWIKYEFGHSTFASKRGAIEMYITVSPDAVLVCRDPDLEDVDRMRAILLAIEEDPTIIENYKVV